MQWHGHHVSMHNSFINVFQPHIYGNKMPMHILSWKVKKKTCYLVELNWLTVDFIRNYGLDVPIKMALLVWRCSWRLSALKTRQAHPHLCTSRHAGSRRARRGAPARVELLHKERPISSAIFGNRDGQITVSLIPKHAGGSRLKTLQHLFDWGSLLADVLQLSPRPLSISAPQPHPQKRLNPRTKKKSK